MKYRNKSQKGLGRYNGGGAEEPCVDVSVCLSDSWQLCRLVVLQLPGPVYIRVGSLVCTNPHVQISIHSCYSDVLYSS